MFRNNKTKKFNIIKFTYTTLIIANIIIIVLFSLRTLEIINPHILFFRMDFMGYWKRSLGYFFIMLTWSIFAYDRIFKHNKKHWEVSVLVLMTILFLDSLGNLFGWYTVDNKYSLQWYDQFTHFSNSALISLVIFFVLWNQTKVSISRWTNHLILFTGVSLGVLFEFSEYFNDYYFGTSMIGGIEDTILDVTANTLGILLTISILTYISRAKSSPPNVVASEYLTQV